ncbi:MAG: hypothetical protein ACYDC5_01645 [Candidatus Dormibacteria bacterium]
MPFRYLAGNQMPDHKTISEFRRVPGRWQSKRLRGEAATCAAEQQGAQARRVVPGSGGTAGTSMKRRGSVPCSRGLVAGLDFGGSTVGSDGSPTVTRHCNDGRWAGEELARSGGSARLD